MSQSVISLFGIQAEYYELVNQLMENEGELDQELEEALTINTEMFMEKAKNYGGIIRYLEGNAAMVKEEAARLAAVKKRIDNSVERLKAALVQALEARGEGTVEVGTTKLWLGSTEAVDIPDESLIPSKFTTKKVVIAPDKALIKAELKKGKKVKGATLVTNKHLRMK